MPSLQWYGTQFHMTTVAKIRTILNVVTIWKSMRGNLVFAGRSSALLQLLARKGTGTETRTETEVKEVIDTRMAMTLLGNEAIKTTWHGTRSPRPTLTSGVLHAHSSSSISLDGLKRLMLGTSLTGFQMLALSSISTAWLHSDSMLPKQETLKVS